MASGDSFPILGATYNVQASVLETIIMEICEIVIQYLQPEVMPTPNRKKWMKIRKSFWKLYDMPNCMGSLYGRFVAINNKQFMFLAVVDASYKFVMIDVGDYCDGNPAKVWPKSIMSKQFENHDFEIPTRRRVNDQILPYVMVAGNSFAPDSYIIKTFRPNDVDEIKDVHKIFNSRIAPIKDIAEEAMTNLRRRWQVVQRRFEIEPQKVERVILAACCLYNHFNASTSAES